MYIYYFWSENKRYVYCDKKYMRRMENKLFISLICTNMNERSYPSHKINNKKKKKEGNYGNEAYKNKK